MPPHHLPYGSGTALSHLGQRTAANQGNSPSYEKCPLATAEVNGCLALATAGVNSGFLPHTGYSGNFASSPEVHIDMIKMNTDAPMLGQTILVYYRQAERSNQWHVLNSNSAAARKKEGKKLKNYLTLYFKIVNICI